MNPHLSNLSAIHLMLSLAEPCPPKVKKQYQKIRGVDPLEFCNNVMASTLFSLPASNVNDLSDQYDIELGKVVDVHAPLKTCFVTSRPSVCGIVRKLPQKNVNVVNWKGVCVSLELKHININMLISVVESISP